MPDRPRRSVEHRPKEVDAALDRIASAFVYAPSGHVAGGDVSIAGTDKRTEYNPDQAMMHFSERRLAAIKPSSTRPVKERDTSYVDWLRERSGDLSEADRLAVGERRRALRHGGLARETYRRVEVAEALERLASAGASRAAG